MIKTTSVKCIECGLVNFAAAESCKRCGAGLITEQTRVVETSSAQVTVAPVQTKVRSSLRDVALMVSLIGAGFLAVMIGGALFLLRSEPRTPRTFSSKAEQVQATMDSYSEAECERNDAATRSPYHTMTDQEKAARYFCTLKAMKVQNPIMFDEAMKPLRAQPPNPSR